jgi:hypothetical protein
MSGPLAGLFGALLAEMSDRNAYDHGLDHVDYGVTEFDDRAGTPGAGHRAQDSESRAPRELVTTGPVQPFCQRRVLARSTKGSQGPTDRMTA